MTYHWLFACTGLSGLLSVALGAFAAHGLAPQLGERGKALFDTAFEYQIAHTLVLLVLAYVSTQRPLRKLEQLAAGAFLIGILLFSGSLYLMALHPIPQLGIITPMGGLSFLIGWLCVLLLSIPGKRRPN